MGMISVMFLVEIIKGFFFFIICIIYFCYKLICWLFGMGFFDNENGFEFFFIVFNIILRFMEKVYVFV